MRITPEEFKVGDQFILINKADPSPSVWTLESFDGPDAHPVFEGAGVCSTQQPYMAPIPRGATKDQIKALLHILL